MRLPAFLALLLLAGCLSPPPADDWRPMACAGGTERSANASLAAFWAGSPETVARRVGDALDEPVRARAEASGWAWTTPHGTIRVEPEVPMVSFFGTGEAWLDAARMQRALERLGVWDEVAAEPDGDWSTTYLQRWAGAAVARASFSSTPDHVSEGAGYGTFTDMNLGDLRDLSGAAARLTRAEAEAKAAAFVACRGDWPQAALQHGGGFDVAADSLAHRVTYGYPTPDEHCTTSYVDVLVDAMTGTVLAAEPSLCA
ncbi:MAG: hypothetical protein QOD77_809 [Thermoplasmata archaeon]|nr:hypothetical protein [Thermoplasmata archaeon]